MRSHLYLRSFWQGMAAEQESIFFNDVALSRLAMLQGEPYATAHRDSTNGTQWVIRKQKSRGTCKEDGEEEKEGNMK